MPTVSECPQSVRLDVWLWRARFFKTRSDASKSAAAGRVRIARPGRQIAAAKASFLVAAGDVITFRHGGRIYTVEVLDVGVRRGPSEEARGLYRDAVE